MFTISPFVVVIDQFLEVFHFSKASSAVVCNNKTNNV